MNLAKFPVFRPSLDATFFSLLKVSGQTFKFSLPMRSVFEMAHLDGLVPDNIMLKVKNKSVTLPDIYPFTYEEVVRILEVVDIYYRPYTACRFFTGMRSGEINALTWPDYKNAMPTGPKIHVNKAYVYGVDGLPKTKKSNRYVDCNAFVVEALEDQRKFSSRNKHIFITKKETRMNPDHYRDVVWKKALKKAGLEYRPPIQTRHTFATMMLSSGEDIGWVKTMLGHSSLQMIFTRYYAWIPNKTRNDGAAFMATVGQKQGEETTAPKEGAPAKVIQLFPKNDTITTHPNKKGLR